MATNKPLYDSPGAPTKYKPEYCQEIIEFFDIDPYEPHLAEDGTPTNLPKKIPLLEDFAISIGVDPDTLLNWKKKNKEFFGAIKKAKKMQESFLIHATAAGIMERTFSIFIAKNVCGWSDIGRLSDLHCPIHRCKTPAAKIKRIQQAVDEETATMGQAKMLCDQVLAEVAVKDATEYEKEMKELRELINKLLNERNGSS